MHVNYGNQVGYDIYTSTTQKKDEYLANLSKQQPNVPMEEMTPDLKVSLQLLMDEVRQLKGKKLRGL
ncbi:hypothetical protein C1H46_031425 [Malus baccata]|uniref:Uncharacterized protein n=1 Tax=Malus baccata TaxID=106549 RepID=A0A540L9P9_MALBA|nr:hypothetical protein C1H46_031425 [Malus baccata]